MEVRELARFRATYKRKIDPWVNAKAYLATYIRRWEIPHERCAACNSPRASAYPPNPQQPRTYLWLCRTCARLGKETTQPLIAAGRLQTLARPARPETQTPEPERGPTGRDPLAFDAIDPVLPTRLAAARTLTTIATRQGAASIITLATHYLGLLGEAERAHVERIGSTVDLTRWRPYGEDDLDLSLINLFYRRRQREISRARTMAAMPTLKATDD
jgi:hypothetical protein